LLWYIAIKSIQPAAGPTGHAELVAEPLKPLGPVATERALEKPHLCTADPGAVAAIVGAYHSTPFEVLGIHPHIVDGKPAIVIRTFQPQALAVTVARGDQLYPMHRVHRDGFFEVVIQNQTAVSNPKCNRAA
jgi:alpha-1,4-glucan branching enzyme GlgB, N-terminal domain